MTLDEAIKILEDIRDTGIDAGHYDAEDAIDLLIEAGKRFQDHSPYPHEYLGGPLPGETED